MLLSLWAAGGVAVWKRDKDRTHSAAGLIARRFFRPWCFLNCSFSKTKEIS